MKKQILSKGLIYEHCATMPNKSFSADDIGKSLRKDGITRFSRGSISQHFLTLVKEQKIQREHMGRYSIPKTFKEVDSKVDADLISTAELGKSVVAYIQLLQNEVKELKSRLGGHEVVNIRDLTGGRL